jgi:PAS domain S-box-containing protein
MKSEGELSGRTNCKFLVEYLSGLPKLMKTSQPVWKNPDRSPDAMPVEPEFAHLADFVPQFVWICTSEGENIYFNQRWMEYTGMTLEESRGRGWNAPFHADDQLKAWNAWNHAVETGKPYQVESRLRAADGSYRWFLMRGQPFQEADGRIVKWFGTCTDIHDMKLIEQALIRSEKLATAGRMAATVAHEINNPLEAVTNLLYLAKSTDEISTIHGYIADAEAELSRVTHITRQSLGFYRESKGPELSSIQQMVESAIGLLKARIAAKQATIETRWGRDVRLAVVGGELRQVFANLLANSLDAIAFNGMVKVRTSVAFDHRKQAPCFRILVADNGKGIPRNLRHHLFEPFFTTKGATGTGLGLWVCKQILDKHEGVIQVRSVSEGQQTGTVIRITLPRVPRVED